MERMKLLLVSSLLLVALCPANMQDASTNDSAKTNDGRRDPSRDFDFWIGEWECRNPAGALSGRNHGAIEDVQAIVHAHPKWSTFLTMVGESYEPVYAQGTLVYPMPVLDSPNSINNPDMARRLADTLGDRPAAMMKSHGAVTCGKNIVEAFVLANYLEENAYRQYRALQIGRPYAFSEEEVAACQAKLWNETLFKRTWDHFSAKLAAG